MALRYEFDDNQTHVIIIGSGPFTMSSMLDMVDRVAADSRFHSNFPVVVDLRNAEYEAQLNNGGEFVAALKRREKDFQGKFALVVPEQMHFLGRLYTALAAARGIDRMRCFISIEEARKWCGLPE